VGLWWFLTLWRSVNVGDAGVMRLVVTACASVVIAFTSFAFADCGGDVVVDTQFQCGSLATCHSSVEFCEYDSSYASCVPDPPSCVPARCDCLLDGAVACDGALSCTTLPGIDAAVNVVCK
jgi:hypothetical protein